ncbi:sterol desaturase family protein [Undibacterium jejuense]|uniref:Sterol desaturase family protein n=1 Tax=Undibacterium jejuense TaxID=1344949 RepID=A0A923HKF8_9BURK|nr:sterol desaturase family protein [Undibacterium jejuense]MBC3863372.1 sterol desaturase family protein [Undibacterium jejuense]
MKKLFHLKVDMSFLSLEQSRRDIAIDFLFYGFNTLFLTLLLCAICPSNKWLMSLFLVALGVVISSAVEYLSHRFILHGLKPFSVWHHRHHQQPKSSIGTPTIVSAALILVLIFLPMWLFTTSFYAIAITLGVVVGYGAYIVTHHATHHWKGRNGWLVNRKRWHALHHCVNPDCCYGVSSSFWDHLFATGTKKIKVENKY